MLVSQPAKLRVASILGSLLYALYIRLFHLFAGETLDVPAGYCYLVQGIAWEARLRPTQASLRSSIILHDPVNLFMVWYCREQIPFVGPDIAL
jgi:hypothetical protein